MRAVPLKFQAVQLVSYDDLVRSAFSFCTSLFPDNEQWAQATRGFNRAGLGLRSAVFHSAAAYLASRAATQKACAEIDPDFTWDPSDASTLSISAPPGHP